MDFFYYEIVFFVQALFSGEGAEHGRKLVTPQLNGTETGDRPHTLEEYATDHFRWNSLHFALGYSLCKCKVDYVYAA